VGRSTVVRFPPRDESGPTDFCDYTVRITGSGLAQDFLCLEYLVFPVPPALLGDDRTHEGDAAGLAVHGATVHRCCRSGYRTAADEMCVVGAVKIGPAAWPVFGRIAVLFAPFAHTPRLSRELCEARLVIADGRVRSARISTIER
jgi:hypothetical protein